MLHACATTPYIVSSTKSYEYQCLDRIRHPSSTPIVPCPPRLLLSQTIMAKEQYAENKVIRKKRLSAKLDVSRIFMSHNPLLKFCTEWRNLKSVQQCNTPVPGAACELFSLKGRVDYGAQCQAQHSVRQISLKTPGVVVLTRGNHDLVSHLVRGTNAVVLQKACRPRCTLSDTCPAMPPFGRCKIT